MKKATFSHGVIIALVISISIAAVFSLFHNSYLDGEVFRFLIITVAFPYLVYLLLSSKQRLGRISVILIWLIISVATFVFISSLMIFILSQLFMLWMIRSLYFYNNILSTIADLFLMVMSFIVAIWVWSFTGSLFVTFWCFFLMQALFVFIPIMILNKKNIEHDIDDGPLVEPFDTAYHSAEQAVAKLVNNKQSNGGCYNEK